MLSRVVACGEDMAMCISDFLIDSFTRENTNGKGKWSWMWNTCILYPTPAVGLVTFPLSTTAKNGARSLNMDKKSALVKSLLCSVVHRQMMHKAVNTMWMIDENIFMNKGLASSLLGEVMLCLPERVSSMLDISSTKNRLVILITWRSSRMRVVWSTASLY